MAVTIGATYGDENRRLRAAFFISALLHMGVLWFWWQKPLPAQSISHGSLEVSFLQVARPVKISPPVPVVVPEAPPLLVTKKLKAAEIATAVKPLIVPPTKPASPPAQDPTAVTSDGEPLKASAAPGKLKRPVLRTGEASAVMVVDSSGRVGVIFWNRLPALTDEQMQIVETRIRQRRYEEGKRGGALSEIVNVFDILRESTRPDGVPPAPTSD